MRTYGCQMNQYEAGIIRELLAREGYRETGVEENANVLLLLTCSVRAHAEQRALGYLQHLRGFRRRRPELALAVLGCMAQRRGEELIQRYGANIVVGPDSYRLLPALIRAWQQTRSPQIAISMDRECYEGVLPRPATATLPAGSATDRPATGMVAVTRGCDNRCTYCIVPYVRGSQRSKSAAAVLAECEALLSRGVVDITLIGQNVLAYRDGNQDFSALLRLVNRTALASSKRIRIRFLTAHPRDVSPELAAAMSDLESVCPHLHLPLQSGSDRILTAMNRGYTRQQYLQHVAMLRQAVPDLLLTTDILVGFPGETDEDFAQTLELVERIRFGFAYMFRYSPRPGTPAAGLDCLVPEPVARERLTRVIDLQNRITRELNQQMVGREYEVLVECRHGRDYLARTRDGRMVALKQNVPVGRLLNVLVVGISGWTPVAQPVASLNEEPAEIHDKEEE